MRMRTRLETALMDALGFDIKEPDIEGKTVPGARLGWMFFEWLWQRMPWNSQTTSLGARLSENPSYVPARVRDPPKIECSVLN